ncbi:MAG: (E)-4-hydroxy-3-methylbut-2-enyl-diphosphate synthase, partial [Clostridia bacterium]|nr:(E)-4-hydroxy-3-methylbut-2-enyl-diphosphate synthase [Clostridia bacterium]
MDYNSIRRKTKQINVGGVKIGGGAPVSVQSMTNTDTMDFDATLSQVTALEKAGCDIVRLAVPKIEAAKTIYRLKEAGIRIPLVADIHFDYKIALECVECGADKIRINPGNIGSDERVRAVARACAAKNVPIRVGVNSGSLNKEVLEKYGSPTPEALAESAMTHVKLLQKFDFDDICIAIKSSSPSFMIAANRAVAALTDHPIHIGVTEAGTPKIGMMRSSVGIGSLLCDGIGDTLRVSLTADPLREVEAGRDLL